jgi:hypothetical protein
VSRNSIDVVMAEDVHPDEPTHDDETVETPDESWTNERIVDYATEHGIDLTGAKTKPEYLAAIEAAGRPQ